MGEQPTFAEQIKLHNEMKQKSKNESEESQLPSNQKGCNERQGFRGNCDSQGKLGMCPSLAEPDSGGFPKNDFHNVSRETLLLGKTVFNIRQKGVPPLLLPASLLQLQQEKQAANTICFANVGCSPTPRQHFYKTAAPKNFSIRLRLDSYSQYQFLFLFHVKQF